MQTIAIDFNNPIPYENMVIGKIGEHNATEIVITPPSELSDCESVTIYIIAFVLGDMVIHSEPFKKAETLSVKLWRQLTAEPVMGIQLEAYDANENYIGKSELISSLRLSPSACGDDTVADTDNPDIASAVAANTLARHEHENKDVLDTLNESLLDDIGSLKELSHSHTNKSVLERLTRSDLENISLNTNARHTHKNAETLGKLGDSEGKLTYDGRAVGERATKTVTFTSLCNDFYYTSPVTRCFLIDVLAKDGLTSGTEIKSILIKGENGFIDIKDLSIKENEGKPCIVSYLHADYDDGSTLMDDNGNYQQGVNIATLYFPNSGTAYTKFSNENYSEIEVEFYTEGIS
ncbi:MAG: hypothetical protein ACI4I3_06070 [Acutalibacteraceae bacterium]